MNEVVRSIDPLGEALHSLRMTGAFYCRSEFSEPWALELPPMKDCLMFHVMTSGQCFLETGDAAPRLLKAGDFALVPHGEGHTLTSARGVVAGKLFDLPREQVSERYEVLRHGAGGQRASAICGAVRFDHPTASRLVKLLPSRIVIDAWESTHLEWMQSTLRWMASEAKEPRAGGEAIITRLADILVIQAIRFWIERDPAAQIGWLGALRDKQIGRALCLIHRDPRRDWTVQLLAEESAMSRSAFAARFTELVGEPAMHYVARSRMHAATTLLAETNATLAELAGQLGYESEAAFSRAFKRVIGVSPSVVRKNAVPLSDRDGAARPWNSSNPHGELK